MFRHANNDISVASYQIAILVFHMDWKCVFSVTEKPNYFILALKYTVQEGLKYHKYY